MPYGTTGILNVKEKYFCYYLSILIGKPNNILKVKEKEDEIQ